MIKWQLFHDKNSGCSIADGPDTNGSITVIKETELKKRDDAIRILYQALYKIIEADKLGYGTDSYPVIAKRAIEQIEGLYDNV